MATVSITNDLEPYLASLRSFLGKENSQVSKEGWIRHLQGWNQDKKVTTIITIINVIIIIIIIVIMIIQEELPNSIPSSH